MPAWMSRTLSAVPMVNPEVARTAALSTRELPAAIIASGVEQAPGAVPCACKETALAAASASMYVAVLSMFQIYTNRFSGGPAERSIPLDKRAAGELLLSRSPLCLGLVA